MNATTKYPRPVLRLIQALRRRRTARSADPAAQLELDRQRLTERQADALDRLGRAALIHPDNAVQRLRRPYTGPAGFRV